MIPFQIIFIQGLYNDKNFKEKFLSFGDFNIDEQVEKIKNKLNVRYRESLISSTVISTKYDEDIKVIDFKSEIISNEIIYKIQSFFQNNSNSNEFILPHGFDLINKYTGLKYTQKVENRWDERGDGRPDIEYDEITYFEGNISIFSFTFNSN
jgi:hypothetical protein